jgi:quinol-cytochrome oxidoreductase complex cytochrome b subunit
MNTMAEQNEQQTTTDRMHAEVSRIFAEIARMQAEQEKLKSESMKINCETFWYPMGIAMAVVATIASITGMAIKLLL